jgi:glycosyltransferase involved in cell wall biosynthesis
MRTLPITVIVSVKNEELNLPHCLEKLSAFDEVLVIDSKSTDKTPLIAKEFGYQVIDFEWNGKFPKKRNWALQNIPIKNEWVLFLDADEYLNALFVKELKHEIATSDCDGFWIVYNNFFMGKELKYGDKMKKLALFKRSKGEFEKIEEDNWSHLDMEVHEHPIIRGKVGVLKSPITHKDFKSLDHYIAKHNSYSSWEASRFLQLSSKKDKHLTTRQKLKYKLIQGGLLPTFYFLGAYVLKLGFLDGKEGYYLARFKEHYFFQIQTKLKELTKKQL